MQGLWEVTRSCRWNPHEWDSALIKENPLSSTAPPTMRGQRKRAPAMNEEVEPHQKSTMWHLNLRLPHLLKFREIIVCCL